MSVAADPSIDREDEPANAGEPPSHPDRPPVRWVPVVLCALGLVICTSGFSTYVANHLAEGSETWNSWMYLYPFALVAIVATGALAVTLRRIPRRQWPWPLYPIAAFAFWALLSTTWSVHRSTTLPAALIDIGIAAFGCWFGWRLIVHEQIWSLTLATSAVGIASAVVMWVRPEYGKMVLPPEVSYFVQPWQGIFANRNSLAPVCVLGLLSLVGLVISRPNALKVVVAIPLAIVHIWLLRNSGGITSQLTLALLGCTAVGVPLLWVLRRARVPGTAVAVVAGSGVVLSWWLFFSNLPRLTSAVGRESTLSNRRDIWADVRGFISDRPLVGHGHWAFWERPDLTAQTYAELKGPYGSAHNSALEVMLALGVVGLVLYLVIVMAAVAGIFSWAWSERSAASWWWSMLLVFLISQNLLESFVLWHSYNWVLFLAAVLVPFGAAARRSPVTPSARSFRRVGAQRTNE